MIRKCVNCGSANILEITELNLAFFLCSECRKKSGMALQEDGKIIVKDTPNGIKHITVGALIIRDGKVLLGKRRTFPYRYSNIAGHLEYGEKPKEAIWREISEEAGLKVEDIELIFHGDIIGNKCRAGANIHEWYFYNVKYSGEPLNNNEFEHFDWYGKEDLEELDLGFATRYLFEKIDINKRLKND